jgi:hypothetical protein
VGRYDAAAGEGIEMGCFDIVYHTMDTEIGVAMVVSVDEDDVGPCREERGAECEEDEVENSAHDAA